MGFPILYGILVSALLLGHNLTNNASIKVSVSSPISRLAASI